MHYNNKDESIIDVPDDGTFQLFGEKLPIADAGLLLPSKIATQTLEKGGGASRSSVSPAALPAQDECERHSVSAEKLESNYVQLVQRDRSEAASTFVDQSSLSSMELELHSATREDERVSGEILDTS